MAPHTRTTLAAFLTRVIWLSLLPLMVLAIWLAVDDVIDVKAENERRGAAVAQDLIAVIDHALNARIGALGILAASPLVDDEKRWGDLYREAQGFRASFGGHVVLSDVGDPMRMLFNTREPYGTTLPPLPRPKGRAAPPSALQSGKPAVGDSFLGPVAKQPLVAIAVPVVRGENVVHLVLATFETRVFGEVMDTVDRPQAWSVFLRDGEGATLAQRPASASTKHGNAEGGASFVASSTVARWSVVVQIPRDAYLHPIVTAAVVLGSALLGALLLGLFGSAWAARRLGNAIASLAQPLATGSPAAFAEVAAARELLDRTERQRRTAESALREGELRFRSTFEEAAVGIALVSPEGRLLEINRRLCDILGTPHDALILKRFVDAIYPEDRSACMAAMDRLASGDIERCTMEGHCLREDDRAAWISLTIALARRPDGTTSHYIVAVEDIDMRKQVEAWLLESEERLKVAQRIAHIGSWEHDHRTGALTWSDEIYRIFEIEPDAGGMTYDAFIASVHPDDRAMLSQAYAESLDKKTPYEIEHRLAMKDGRIKHILERCETEYDPAGLPIRSRGTALDITERKQTELALQQSQAAALEEQQRARLAALNLMEDAIAARERAETANAALRASEQRYRYLAENISDVVWILDVDTLRFEYMSPSVQRLRGYSADEVLGQTLADVLTPDSLAQARDLLPARIAAFRAGDPRAVTQRHEVQQPCKDGSIIWTEVVTTLLAADDGRLRILGVTRNIEERKASERALQASASLTRSVQDSVLAHLAVLDAAGVIIAVNAAWREFALANSKTPGSPAARTEIGTNYLEVCRNSAGEHSDEALAAADGIQAVLERRLETFTLEYSCHSPSECRWFVMSVTPLRTKAGGAVVSHTSITERKLAELALRETEEELRKLARAVEQSPNSIVITDLEGSIQYVNDAFTRISGFDREETIGRNSRFLQSGRTPRETYHALWSALMHGESWKGEFINRRKSGEEFVEFALVSPIRQSDGRVTHYLAIKDDVTEQKRIGEELHRHRHHLMDLVNVRTAELATAKEAAEAANRTKSTFLANMSHEIRTPMNAIIGLTHLLRRDSPRQGARARLDGIQDAARHLLSIINDILDLSKIEAGKIDLVDEEFDLETIMRNACAMVADRASAKGLELVVDVDHLAAALPGGHLVRGDSTRISQATLNYLSNAVKFTDRGSIQLRLRLVEEDTNTVLVRIEVQDTGIGIGPKDVERLFNAFEQADTSTTRRFGGTGLGLAITRHLAKLMGGETGVSSAPGVGSTFWLTARLGKGSTPARVLALESVVGQRVVVAIQRSESCSSVCAMLDALGLQYDSVTSGEAALECIRAAETAGQAFHYAILDSHLADMSAVDFARSLRSMNLARTPACLLMVVPAQADAHIDATDTNIRAILRAPVTVSTLFDAIQTASGDAGLVARPLQDSRAEQLLAANYRHVRILLAEDNPINQEVALDLLREAGLNVDLAQNGVQAVAMATSNRYDLLLMDVQMPEMDGLEATRAIRRLPGYETCPILAMTANAFAEDRAECVAAGMSDHVSKPVDPDFLFRTLLKWLPRHNDREQPRATARSAESGDDPVLRLHLRGLPDFDLESALQVARGRPARLLQLLQLFAENHLVDVEQLRRRPGENDTGSIERLAHALKGAAGTLGLQGVQHQADALVTAVRAGTPAVEALAQALSVSLAEAITAIGRLPSSSSTGQARPSAVVAAPAPAMILDRLEGLLSASDFEASAVFEESAGIIKLTLGGAANELGRLIRTFEYKEALKLLQIARRNVRH